LKYLQLSRFLSGLHRREMKQCTSAVCKPAFLCVISCYRAVDKQWYLPRSTGRAYRLYQTRVLVSACGQLTGCGLTLGHTAGGTERGAVRVLQPAQQSQPTFSQVLQNIRNSVTLNVPRLRPLVLGLITVALRYKLLWSIGRMILTGVNRI
jgi:hypothetical protein